MRIVLVRLVIVIVLIGAVLCCAGLYSAFTTRRRAEKALVMVRALRVGKSSLEEVEAIRRAFPANSQVASPQCGQKDYIIIVNFQPIWPVRALRQMAGLSSMISYHDGRLTVVRVDAACWEHYGFQPYVVSVIQNVPNEFYLDHYYVGGTALDGKMGFISVHFGPSATDEQRRQAYGFKLNFLALGHCNDAREMLSPNRNAE
jgi:hypothetical protein